MAMKTKMENEGSIIMKNLRRFMALALVMMLFMVTMTGCGSKSEETTATSETTTEATESTDAASSDSDESALLQKIKERGYIVIGSSNDAPFSYQDVTTGELAGVDIEILKEICNRLGIADIQMKVVDFSNLLVELNNENIDFVVDAMYVKDERLQIAAFTNKWYTEGEAVVIAADSDITSKEDLKTASVGAQPGTTFYETAQEWLDAGRIAELVAYDNQATLMTAVNMGQVDAILTDGIVAGYTLASDSSLELKLLSPYETEASGQIGAAARFDDIAFVEEVNATLDEMKADGTLMQILTDYGLNEDYFVGIEEGITTNIK